MQSVLPHPGGGDAAMSTPQGLNTLTRFILREDSTLLDIEAVRLRTPDQYLIDAYAKGVQEGRE